MGIFKNPFANDIAEGDKKQDDSLSIFNKIKKKYKN